MITDSLIYEVGVVPILVGPLQVLLALLPGILLALGGMVIAMFKPSTVKHLCQLLWSQKLVVIVILFCGWGIWGLLGSVGAGADDVSSKEDGGSLEWSVWRGGPSRRGFVVGDDEPASGGRNWTFLGDDGDAFYSSPAIVGNRLYITSAMYGVFSDRGGIHCLDADSGKSVWRYDDSGYRSAFSSPAVAGKYLVVGEGLHLTNDARVFCIDIEESEKQRRGVKVWEYRTNSHVESSPGIAGGRVYIGAGSDGFYCFDLEGDGKGDAKVLWHLPGEDYPDCETSPVVYEGRVYFGLGIGGQAVVCADAVTGELIWKIDTPYPVFSSPSIVDGKLFVGMGHGDFINSAEQVSANLHSRLVEEGVGEAEIAIAIKKIVPSGEVWCIDLASGEVDWRFEAERTVLGSVAVDGDRVYFGSRDGNLYCLSTGGELKGKWDSRAVIITSPTVGEQYVYTMTEAGQVFCLDKETLTPRWSEDVGSPSLSSMAVARGQVYVGTSEKGLLSLGQMGMEDVKNIWQGYLGGEESRYGGDGSLLFEHGAYGWGLLPLPGHEKDKLTGVTINGPSSYVDGRLYVGVNHGESYGLACMDKGESLGRKPTIEWFAGSDNPVLLSAAGAGEVAYFVDGESGQSGRKLRCVGSSDGKVLWEEAVGDDASGQFTITDERLFIADSSDGVSCFDIRVSDGGKRIWRAEIGRAAGQMMVVGDVLLLAVEGPGVQGKVVAIDTLTGAVLWEHELDSNPTTGVVFAGERVWVGSGTTVSGHSLINGYASFTVDDVLAGSELVTNGKYVALTDQRGEIVLINADCGSEQARVAGAVGGYPPLLCGDSMLYYADGSIERYEIETGESGRWVAMRASWPGRATSEMVMIDSHVLFGTDKRSFVCMKPKKR